MGMNLKIGEGAIEVDGDNKYWFVPNISDSQIEAPCWSPEWRRDANCWGKSYYGWRELDQALDGFLFRLLAPGGPPPEGTLVITDEICQCVRAEFQSRLARSSQPAGFGHRNNYELSFLTWLDWWVHWAYQNCVVPVIHWS